MPTYMSLSLTWIHLPPTASLLQCLMQFSFVCAATRQFGRVKCIFCVQNERRLSHHGLTVAWFPGPFEKLEKRAWYPLFAHVVNLCKAHVKLCKCVSNDGQCHVVMNGPGNEVRAHSRRCSSRSQEIMK